MKNIAVSIDVFAEIWKRRKPGQVTEDDILRDTFGLSAPANYASVISVTGETAEGWVSDRGVELPEGFRIFRVINGKKIEVEATGGTLRRIDTNEAFRSLGALSFSLGAVKENAWYAWKYRKPDGTEDIVHNLRDPAQIRPRRNKTADNDDDREHDDVA